MMPRFHDGTKEWATRCEEFSRAMGPQELWSIVHQAQLYIGEYWIARSIKIADLLRSTLDVPGSVAEFGTWHGANLLHMAKLLRIFDPHSPKIVHGFDSFDGLQTFAPEDGDAVKFRSCYQGSYEHLQSVIELLKMDQEVRVHRGDVTEVLPRFLREQPAQSFSFVYCDVDLYEPTRSVLRNVHAHMTVGGLIVLDEYGWEDYPGETAAVDEFLLDYGAHYDVTFHRDTRQPTLSLRRRSSVNLR